MRDGIEIQAIPASIRVFQVVTAIFTNVFDPSVRVESSANRGQW